MLELGELVRQIRAMMVVDHRKCCHDLPVAVDGLRHQALANQVAYRLGAVPVTTPGDHPIELLQQVFFDGNPGPCQLRHVAQTPTKLTTPEDTIIQGPLAPRAFVPASNTNVEIV